MQSSVQPILEHLGLPIEPPQVAPARGPPHHDADMDQTPRHARQAAGVGTVCGPPRVHRVGIGTSAGRLARQPPARPSPSLQSRGCASAIAPALLSALAS